jgi:hypothetical protein
MAKTAKPPEIDATPVPATPNPVPPDLTPAQSLAADWKNRHPDIGRYITNTGQMRSGLKPSDQAKAREILKSYGF